MVKKVGIIGLGKMGMAMAERLMETGVKVVGTDLFPQTRDNAKERGVDVTASSEEVFQRVDIVILSLPTAKDVESTVAPLLNSKREHELIIIDTTTSNPRVTEKLEAALEPMGVHLVDAPVSGGFFGARAGTLGIMVGGKAEYVASAMEILEKLGGKIVHMGAPGAGHSTKLLNNLLGAANLVATAEIVRLGDHLGLDAEKLTTILSAGGARNSATEINYPRWVHTKSFDSGFTMKLMRKDVALAEELVNARGKLPILEDVATVWAASKGAVDDQADFNKIVEFHPGE